MRPIETANWPITSTVRSRPEPGVSADDRQRLASLTGVHDRQPAIGEPYMQWVLEDRFSNGRPDLAAAGVELRSDVHAYEAMKGRLLNAAHMLLAYPAILLGYRLVAEAMADHRLLAMARSVAPAVAAH